MGRTGKMWAIEHEDVEADMIVFAKGIASGMVISGIATRKEYMLKSPPGSMGGTFGANAVSAAAAVATLEVFREENILANVVDRGEQLQNGLKRIQKMYGKVIQDVRGRGLMVGLEFDRKLVPEGFAGLVTAACMEKNLLLLTTGWRETIRFIPPLNISEEEVNIALDIVEHALAIVIDKCAISHKSS